MQHDADASASSLSLLAEVFEKAPAFMAVLGGRQHVFEMANPAYYQLVGHRDLLGKPLLTALPEVEGQGYVELLDAVLRTGDPFIGNEMKVTIQDTPHGPRVERYVDFVYQARRNADGEVIGVFAHGVDITNLVTARLKSEERAQQIKQQAQTSDTLLSNITDFVYTFDLNGRFLYANKPLLDLLGISLEEIAGKNFHELPYPEALATTLQAQIQQVIDTQMQVVGETPYTSPNGTAGHYEYIFSPVFDPDGQVVIVAGSTRNITERVLQDRAKDEFLGIVSHELKTPVTSIKAYVQTLQKRLTKEGNMSAAAYLAKANLRIDKLTALIGDLLDVTRINSGKLQFREVTFAFDDEVAEAVEEVQRTTEHHRILLEGKTNQLIYGDRDRIGQAIANLLTNAVKYSPQSDRILVTTLTDGATVTLCVQDFGIGIAEEQLPHVFEQFYRAPEDHHSTVPGLGLGLYIASEIVRRHGGEISVESARGQGSTFCFSLPILPRQTLQGPSGVADEMARAHA